MADTHNGTIGLRNFYFSNTSMHFTRKCTNYNPHSFTQIGLKGTLTDDFILTINRK